MDPNLSAWMIAGGPRIENPHAARDRAQLIAFLESRCEARAQRPGLIERFRQLVRPTPVCADLGCCPA